MRRALAGAVAAVLVLLSGCGGEATSADGFTGTRLDPPFKVSDIPLTDTSGGEYSLTGSTDKPLTLVFFGYTHCPDICQVVMADIASAITRLDPADRAKVDVLFVTSDPARDDPKTLRKYLDRFNPDFEGVTGDLKTITAAGNDLGVPVEKGAKLPSGGYEVTHGTQIVAIDDRDRAPIVWTEGTSAADLAADLEALLHQTESSPAS